MKKSIKPGPILILVISIVLVIGILAILKSFPPSDLAEKLNSELNRNSLGDNPWSLPDNTNKSLKKRISGYWQRIEPSQLPEKPFSISDRLELNENGIFWQVSKLTLWLPSGDSVCFSRIQTGYINPFKLKDTDSSAILVDALIRSQAFVQASDTCYVALLASTIQSQRKLLSMSQDVFAKEIKKVKDSLYIDNRSYTMYDTSVYPLADFFPRGSTEIVDNISVKECRANTSFATLTTKELQQFFTSKHSGASDTAAIRAIISRYYEPLVVSELSRHFTIRMLEPLHGSATYTLSIDPSGSVTEVKKNKAHFENQDFEKYLAANIATWRFMPSDGTTQNRLVKYTFSI